MLGASASWHITLIATQQHLGRYRSEAEIDSRSYKGGFMSIALAVRAATRLGGWALPQG
jgi:hypothetical protein